MTDRQLVDLQMRQIVGHEHVIPFDDPQLSGLRHALGGFSPETTPLLLVRPASVRQVQTIVRMAGTLDVGVGVVPNAAANGTMLGNHHKPLIVLDLRRMNQVLEFDVDSGYALVEPGVSFDQLKAHIDERGAAYWVDPDDNGANSVCGSICDRAFGYTPYGDHLMMQCGMEIVTGGGDVMRTGMGALPGSDTWQLFKYNFGPYLDGLFSQSDLAIVTKVGLWLMPVPPACFPFMVGLDDDAALAAAVEVMRPLKIGLVVPNPVVISHRFADRELLAAAGETADLAAHAPWNLFGALYGLEDNVRITWAAVADALATIPGAMVYTREKPPTHPVWPLRTSLMAGAPAYSSLPRAGRHKLWFTIAAPIEGEAVTAIRRIAAPILGDAGVAYDEEFTLSWRTLFGRFTLSSEPGDAGRVYDLTVRLIDKLHAEGFDVSHACRGLDTVVDAAQPDAGLRHLVATLGQALDPAEVFATRGPIA